MSDSLDKFFNDSILNDVIDQLSLRQLNLDFGKEYELKLTPSQIKKAAWVGSLLSLSKNTSHITKAQALAILLKINYPDSNVVTRYTYIILSRIGNLPLSKHISSEMRTNENTFDEYLNFELNSQILRYRQELGGITELLSEFQKSLWDTLHKDKYIAISSPTSSGKSFMIQSYIVEMIKRNEKFQAIYVVPTKALINEVVASFNKRISESNVKIRMGIPDLSVEEMNDREIVVVTPERCLKILEMSVSNKIIPNFIFFDEIQNMEDSERGILFEYVLGEFSKKWTESKIVLAGPFLEKLQEIFKSITGNNCSLVKSDFLSVLQLKAHLQFSKDLKKKVIAKINSPSGNILSQEFDYLPSLYGKVKNDKSFAMCSIIESFGKNSQNLTYANSRTTAERWAIKLTDYNNTIQESSIPEEINDLVHFLIEEVHPKYALVRCLMKGIGFHHSSIPDIARLEIEDLYRKGHIKNLFCTSTLLQGVNLPAQKIFVLTPKKHNDELEDFEFGNLIGRAGRVSSNLFGSIYCIDNDDDEWVNRKLNANYSKQLLTSTSRVFKELKEKVIDSIDKDPRAIKDNKKVANTISLLRHKWLSDEAGLQKYLSEKGLSKDEEYLIIEKVGKSCSNIKIPHEILRLNPTIDPILQNSFYLSVLKDKYSWIIQKHPLAIAVNGDVSEQRSLSFTEKSFYAQFESVSERLDEIFSIKEDIFNENQRGLTIKQIVRYGALWLRGSSYSKLIELELKGTVNPSESEVDSVVRDVIKNINDVVRYELVKYFKVWSDILKYTMTDEERKKFKYFLSLPQMLEFGACDPKALELMSIGVNRSIAVKISPKIPADYTGNLKEWITLNKSRIGLPPIFVKNLSKQGF